MADTWYIDYSAGTLTGQTVANATVGPLGEKATGTIRYIDDITNPNLVRRKHVTLAEYQSLLAAGLNVDAFFMEVSTTDPQGGYSQGQAYARRALAGANYLGSDAKVLFCCDGWMNSVGVTASQWQAYLNGAKSVLGDRAGGYGFADAADLAAGIVPHFVQCGSRSSVRSWVNGWQDNNVQPWVGGIQTDRIQIFTPFGNGGGGAPSGNPNQEDEMSFGAQAPAGTNEHVDIATVGCKNLRIHTSFGHAVRVRAILFYADTNQPGPGGGYDGEFRNPKAAWQWDPNRPGPISIPATATTCTILYDADHPFFVSAALQ